MTESTLPLRVASLRMEAQFHRRHAALLSCNLTNLYGVDAAEVACWFAMADLFDAQAEQLIADLALSVARQEIMQPTYDALAFANSISVKVSLFKLTNQLAQQSHALTLSNLLLQQAMKILLAQDYADDDHPITFILNQISEAAFELVNLEEFQTTSRQSQELLFGLN